MKRFLIRVWWGWFCWRLPLVGGGAVWWGGCGAVFGIFRQFVKLVGGLLCGVFVV